MDKDAGFVRTTVYLPRSLHDAAKFVAVCSRSNISKIIRIALREKVEELRGKSVRKQEEHK